MIPNAQILYDVVDVTWPAASLQKHTPWIIRDGKGGGKRVSAATVSGPINAAALLQAETQMHRLGQTPLFMIREGDQTLDTLLESQNYNVIDPVNMYAAPINDVTNSALPPLSTFCIWEPLAIMADIWAAGGIGPKRQEVMNRATSPKTSLMGRSGDRPASAGFVGLHNGVAMVHALEVLEKHRRQYLGRYMMQAAANWGVDNGAEFISAICTKANVGACSLYSSLGMSIVGEYHYRIHPDGLAD